MKKLDFIESLNYLSDNTLAEAELWREQAPKRRSPAFLKYCAIAACAAVVITAGILIGKSSDFRISRGEVTVASEDSGVEPLPEQRLPSLIRASKTALILLLVSLA